MPRAALLHSYTYAGASPVRGRCPACGVVVWEAYPPAPREDVVCGRCGLDCSVPPGLKLRLRWGLYSLRKRKRLFGIRRMFGMGLRDAFLLPRERDAKTTEKRQSGEVRECRPGVDPD